MKTEITNYIVAFLACIFLTILCTVNVDENQNMNILYPFVGLFIFLAIFFLWRIKQTFKEQKELQRRNKDLKDAHKTYNQ